MDMYQKRKMRQEKKNSESNQESFPKVSINWYIPTLVNFQVNLDFISLFI